MKKILLIILAFGLYAFIMSFFFRSLEPNIFLEKQSKKYTKFTELDDLLVKLNKESTEDDFIIEYHTNLKRTNIYYPRKSVKRNEFNDKIFIFNKKIFIKYQIEFIEVNKPFFKLKFKKATDIGLRPEGVYINVLVKDEIINYYFMNKKDTVLIKTKRLPPAPARIK